MTALKEYDRLEATGLWRPAPGEQRREVIVSLGDATVTLSEISGTVLTHWSVAAMVRANGTARPAIYHLDGDPGETLEIAADETAMIDGIDRVLRAIERRRPHPGKLRLWLGGSAAVALMLGLTLWLPAALERYATTVVPPAKRAEIGQAVLGHMARVTGQPCRGRDARAPLQRLAARVLGPNRENAIVVLPSDARDSAHLPGGVILLGRQVFEDHEEPDIAAGYVLAEALRARRDDPLGDVLDHAGLIGTLRLLTTGSLPDETLASYAERVLTAPQRPVPPDALLSAFEQAGLRSTPYAYAVDPTGETTLPLIEADPHRGAVTPVISDADWVRLQGICGA
jgi:hypothetical protein